MCSLAVSTRYLLTEFKQFCSLVLGGLAEKDAVVIGPLWDAVLYLIDSNKVINIGTSPIRMFQNKDKSGYFFESIK